MLTQEEYYKILADAWEKVDKDSLTEIKAYNRLQRQLRHELLYEGGNKDEH